MKFALRNLFREKISFLLYGGTVTLSVCICQIFLGLLDSPYLCLDISNHNTMFMGSFISLIVIFTCCYLLIYTSQYFLASKSRELGLLRGLGFTLKKLTTYLIYQNMFIFLMFGITGIGLSFVFYQLLLYMIKLFLDNQIIIDFLTLSSVYENIGLFITVFAVVIIFNVGYVYRNKINKLLDNDLKTRNHKIHINNKIYPFIYILSFVFMVTVEHNEIGYILYSVLCAIGSYGIMKYFLPTLFERNTKKYHQTKIMVIMGHLSKRLKNMSLFSFIVIIMSTTMISLLCLSLTNSKDFIRIYIAFIVMYMFLIISVTYKNYLHIDDEILSLSYVEQMGIKKVLLKEIIKKELFSYYIILLGLSLIYIVAILIRFHIYNQLNTGVILFIVCYFVILQVNSYLVILYITLRKGRKVWKL